jgi:hypothetical protein
MVNKPENLILNVFADRSENHCPIDSGFSSAQSGSQKKKIWPWFSESAVNDEFLFYFLQLLSA